jgi:hypothetical protein
MLGLISYNVLNYWQAGHYLPLELESSRMSTQPLQYVCPQWARISGMRVLENE